MKMTFASYVALVLLFCPLTLSAADSDSSFTEPADPSLVFTKSLKEQWQDLAKRIQNKIAAGLQTEDDFAPELKEADALLAAHKGEQTDDVAHVELEKDKLYLSVFGEPAKGYAMLQQLVKDYPHTDVGRSIVTQLPKAAGMVLHQSLKTGMSFPDFSVKDLDGNPLSVASYKGQIVLIDFWATWCGPCMEEMPNVIAAYQKYHSQGFDIIGVSLDQANQREELLKFLNQNQMPWRQYYDGKFWDNALAVKYGILSIPQSILLDRDGNILALSPRGPALAPAIEKALAEK